MALVVYVDQAGTYNLINASALPRDCVAEDVPSHSGRVRARAAAPTQSPRPRAARPARAQEDVTEDARSVLADLAKAGGSKVEPAYDPGWLPELNSSRSTQLEAQTEAPSPNGRPSALPASEDAYPLEWISDGNGNIIQSGDSAGRWLNDPNR